MFTRRVLCLAFPVLLSVVLFTSPPAAGAIVMAACFDNIDMQVPDEVVAGKEFEVIITFPGCTGMSLQEGLEFPWTLGLVISLPGSVIPPVLNNENFRPSFHFLVSIYKTGPLKMMLVDTEGRVLNKWDLKVIPAPSTAHAVKSMDGIQSVQKEETYGALSEYDAGGDEPERMAGYEEDLRFGVLSGVEVKESGKTGIISFSTNSILNYDVFTSAKFSRKWITIIFPKVIPDLPDQLPGGEKIIGEVKLEKRKNEESVRILVEILPVKVEYKVIQRDDSLILMVTSQ